MIQGKHIHIPSLFEKNINVKPIHMGHTLIHAAKKMQIKDAWLTQYSHLKTDFLEHYYEPALKLIPKKHREHTKEALHSYGISPMNKEHVKQLHTWDIR